jgi:hypothetical protein
MTTTFAIRAAAGGYVVGDLHNPLVTHPENAKPKHAVVIAPVVFERVKDDAAALRRAALGSPGAVRHTLCALGLANTREQALILKARHLVTAVAQWNALVRPDSVDVLVAMPATLRAINDQMKELAVFLRDTRTKASYVHAHDDLRDNVAHAVRALTDALLSMSGVRTIGAELQGLLDGTDAVNAFTDDVGLPGGLVVGAHKIGRVELLFGIEADVYAVDIGVR